MPSPLITFHQWKNANPSFKNLIYIFLILIIIFIGLNFLIQSISLAFSIFAGAACAYFLIHAHVKGQTKLKNKRCLLEVEFIIKLMLENNSKFTQHLAETKDYAGFEWEKINGLCCWPTVPALNIDNLLFLVNHDSSKNPILYKIISLKNAYTLLCDTFLQINQHHHLSLKRLHLWETKMKTIKGLRERDEASNAQINERFGSKLYQELVRLTLQLKNTNELVYQNGLDILRSLKNFKM